MSLHEGVQLKPAFSILSEQMTVRLHRDYICRSPVQLSCSNTFRTYVSLPAGKAVSHNDCKDREYLSHALKKVHKSGPAPAFRQLEHPCPLPRSPLHLIFRFRHRRHFMGQISQPRQHKC